MGHRLTLIDADRSPALSRLVPALESLLGSETVWLSPAHAVMFRFDGVVPEDMERLIAEAAIPRLDRALLDDRNARAELLISDMDSTMIRNECIDELAVYAGIGREVAEITVRAMRGDLDFEDALRARVALLEGVPITVFDEIIREKIRIMPGARRLVSVMRKSGAFTALVSGGFTEFTSYVRREIGFDMDQANRLEVRDGVLTGRVLPPILGADAKTAALVRLAVQQGIDVSRAIAVGDGANDIAMIEAAGLGVAFHAHERVRGAADVAISHNDLTALLYIQGWRDDEIEDLVV